MGLKKVRVGDIVEIAFLDHHSGTLDIECISDVGPMEFVVYGKVLEITDKEIRLLRSRAIGGINVDEINCFIVVVGAIQKIRKLDYTEDIRV